MIIYDSESVTTYFIMSNFYRSVSNHSYTPFTVLRKALLEIYYDSFIMKNWKIEKLNEIYYDSFYGNLLNSIQSFIFPTVRLNTVRVKACIQYCQTKIY